MDIEITEYFKKELLLGNVCRICLHLEKCENLADIYETSFLEIFEFVTQIKVQDERGFPKKICDNCKNQVLLSNELKVNVQTSTQVIGELVKAAELELKKWFKCEKCSKLFKYESTKLRHERTHEPEYACPICSKKFGFQSSLKRHLKLHARQSSECPHCSKLYKDVALLSRHIKLVHQAKGFKCLECGAAFGSASSLRVHRATHTPAAARRHRCPHPNCGKAFNFPHHFSKHALTHTGRKKYFCHLCDAGFIQSHHLVAHLKRHQPALWLPCPVPGCQKKLSDKYALKRHMRCHEARKSFMCTECGKCLSSMRSLKGHSQKCQSKDVPTTRITKATSKSKGSANKKLSSNVRSQSASLNADSSEFDVTENLMTSALSEVNQQSTESTAGETVNVNASEYDLYSINESTESQTVDNIGSTEKRVLIEPSLTTLSTEESLASDVLKTGNDPEEQESTKNTNKCAINCCMYKEELRNDVTVVSSDNNVNAIGCCRETVITKNLDSNKTKESVQKAKRDSKKVTQRKTKIKLANIILYKDDKYKPQKNSADITSENALENVVASMHTSYTFGNKAQHSPRDQLLDERLNQPSSSDSISDSAGPLQFSPSMRIRRSSTLKQIEIDNRIQTSGSTDSNIEDRVINLETPMTYSEDRERRRHMDSEITTKDEAESFAAVLRKEHQEVTHQESQQTGRSKPSRRQGVSNTCKTIFGNCLVSGTSAPSEDCLCARMNEDDPVPEFLTPPLMNALEKQGLYST